MSPRGHSFPASTATREASRPECGRSGRDHYSGSEVIMWYVSFRRSSGMRQGLLAFACSVAVVVLAIVGTIASAQPAAQALRVYVLDCGTLIYNNPESYNLTRQEVLNTNMSVAC